MKKELFLYFILAIAIAGGLFLFFFGGLQFIGAFSVGAASMLLIFNTVGRRQLRKAAEQIDKIIQDNKNLQP
jgi:hypothetical protein